MTSYNLLLIAMAEQQTKFVYRNIQLYKSESLGSGSYGGVCKAKCDGLLCAAKIMHPTLFDLRDPGTASYLHKFQEECHLLSLARHPNVVQYLATYYDPDTQLPVLLMELCDESLTTFLERSPGPLSYHVQLNICLDIALALVYLHSNGLIHRDLTENNVLMIAGTRAKITDFGVSKLTTANPRMTALTLCPGNLLYMSPEALDEAKSYTTKLDIFSFGVIVIQILTSQFPNPTDRFRTVHDSRYDEEVRLVVPETERRQAHLQLIPDTHSLKPLAFLCLKKEMQRPSALQLSERLSELKQAPQYTESMQHAQNRGGNETGVEIATLRRQVQEIQQQNIDKEQLNQLLQQQLEGQKILTEATTKEHQARSTQLQRIVEAKDRQLQEKEEAIEAKDRQLQQIKETIEENQKTIATNKHTLTTKQHAIETKEKQLQQTQQQLRDSQQLVEQFQQSLQYKDKTISDLQQTISHHEKEIQQLKQQDIASSVQPQELQATAEKTQASTTASVAQKDISKMTWREGKKAPDIMFRGAAVVHGNAAYFTPYGSVRVYSYKNILGKEQWSRVTDNPNKEFGLAVISGILTSVGGYNSHDVDTNILLSLSLSEEWQEVFPRMPTPRNRTACITAENVLVVAGGTADDTLATVEVMEINTKQWSTVSSLPQKLHSSSGIICKDSFYLAGGFNGVLQSKSVFTCSLSDILQPPTLGFRIRKTFFWSNVWKEISSLPVTGSTLASCGGHLLAIGGWDDSENSTTDVFRYDSHSDSWHITSQMKKKRSQCLVATCSFSENRLIVVGGYGNTDSVEILEDK